MVVLYAQIRIHVISLAVTPVGQAWASGPKAGIEIEVSQLADWGKALVYRTLSTRQ